jgi:GAF domain-containing protein
MGRAAILKIRRDTITDDCMIDASESIARTKCSQSGMLLQAAQLIADIQHRTSSDTGALLGELIEGAAGSVPGAQHAGITVTKPHRPSETAAATHHYPAVLHVVEDRCQQGPCLSAAAQQDRVRVDDLGTDERWPLYREEALRQTPIRSILSFGLFGDGNTTAALNFYAEPINAFDDGSVNLGMMFATHAALVWNMARRDQQFRTALVSRDIIGQAKGMLMERFHIDAAEAFKLLARLSQESNTRVAELSHHVVAGDRAPR